MPYKDINKRRENSRNYKLINKEKINNRRRELYKLKNSDKQIILVSEEHKKKKKSEKDKRYRLKNSEKIKQKKKKYYSINKEKINKKNNLKLKTNIQMRLAHSIRVRMNRSLKGKRKPDSSIKCLGCTMEEFISYIKNKFTDEMTLENYGICWHLDHIKPLYLFNLEDKDEFSLACHYTNYQPLLVLDNLIKNKYYVQSSTLEERTL